MVLSSQRGAGLSTLETSTSQSSAAAEPSVVSTLNGTSFTCMSTAVWLSGIARAAMTTFGVPTSTSNGVLCRVRSRLRCFNRSWSMRVISLTLTRERASAMTLPTLPSPTIPSCRYRGS